MRKILNMSFPMIKCYPHHAGFFSSVIFNDFDVGEVIPNYIELVYNSSIDRIDFNWGLDILNFIKNQPYIDSYCYERKIIENTWKEYSLFIEEMLNNNRYVQLLVDSYYIPAYKEWYMNTHIIHNIIIYGYDKDEFYVADCFENGKFSFTKIDKKEIDNARLKEGEYDWLDGVHCWNLKENVYLCLNMNIKIVKKRLNEYINHKKCVPPTIMEESRRHSLLYGVNVYEGIIKYIKLSEGYLDLRISYVLVEHKKALIYICDKLNSEYKIKNYEDNVFRLNKIEKSTKIVHNYFIKYNMYIDIAHRNNIKDDKYNSIKLDILKNELIGHLKQLKEDEIQELKKFINDISIMSLFRKIKPFKKYPNTTFIIDEKTRGEWKGKYGTKGYYLIGDHISLPQEVKIYNNNFLYVSVLRNSGDSRALCRAKDNNHMVAYYLNKKEFNVEIDVTERIRVSVYLVDYDELKRIQKICVQKKKSGEVLLEYKASNFENGIYISFVISDDVVISINKVNGPDAVLSGIFFD